MYLCPRRLRSCPEIGKRKRGFTLVELLVVIAIIGILVALLLPAIQAAREAANRSSCSNNLKQIGLALHNYHSTYGQFPPGALGEPGPFGDPEWPYFLHALLPYLEQQEMADELAKEPDAQYVGYGAMLMEGVLAVLVILACCAGVGMGKFVKAPQTPGTVVQQYVPETVVVDGQRQPLTGRDAWRTRSASARASFR